MHGDATLQLGGKLVLEAVDDLTERIEVGTPQPEVPDAPVLGSQECAIVECGAKLVVVVGPVGQKRFERLGLSLSERYTTLFSGSGWRGPGYTHR